MAEARPSSTPAMQDQTISGDALDRDIEAQRVVAKVCVLVRLLFVIQNSGWWECTDM